MMGTEESNIQYRGTGIGDGCTHGKLLFFERHSEKRGVRDGIGSGDPRARLTAAICKVRTGLGELQERARRSASEKEAQIFEIHQMLLEDEDLADSMEDFLNEGLSAERAVECAFAQYTDALSALEDPYLRERSRDLEDLRMQILDALAGRETETVPSFDTPFLLVARDLLPSQTVTLDKSMLLGFVIEEGSPTSHTAILARAMGIPALVGVGHVEEKYDGAEALLDAEAGSLCILPDKGQRIAFAKREEAYHRRAEERAERARILMNRPAMTASGKKVLVYANVGDVHEAEAAMESGADGIGLLRSELLYLAGTQYPSEDELTQSYSEVVAKMEGKRVVIRTLDIGADKQVPYFSLPEEENPALGFRGVRVCLAREELFKTQLRAILRASAVGKVALMLPMIVSVEEVRKSRKLLSVCMQELKRMGTDFDAQIELGVMIETPAAAIMSAEIAREVDFFSVGTNDLTQYTLAADRQNPLVSHIREANTEPILRLIEYATKRIHESGGWIGICGELAADFRLTQRFADMGIDELSVSVPYLAGLRQQICECN